MKLSQTPSAAEKLEIIRLLEQSHLSFGRTLAKIGIPPTTCPTASFIA